MHNLSMDWLLVGLGEWVWGAAVGIALTWVTVGHRGSPRRLLNPCTVFASLLLPILTTGNALYFPGPRPTPPKWGGCRCPEVGPSCWTPRGWRG